MNVKKLAFDAIEIIIKNFEYTNEIIHDFLNKYELSTTEKALFINLVKGTIKHRISLEFYLKPYIHKKLKPWVIILLMMAFYEIIYLKNKAAADDIVDIARLKDHKTVNFVKGVLKKISKNNPRSFFGLNEIKKLSVKYSYPQWLVAYLLKDYQYDEVEKIFSAFDNSNLNEFNLNKEITKSIMLKDGSNVLYLNTSPGNLLLDLAENTNDVVFYACEGNHSKYKALRNKFKKANLDNVHLQLVAPLKIKAVVKPNSFDYLIINMPSSGLGVLGENIDLKYHLSLKSIKHIITMQNKILESTYQLVKKGGFYIIFTKTLNKEENQELIRNFVEKYPEYEIINERTILPFEFITDGVYIGKMRRN